MSDLCSAGPVVEVEPGVVVGWRTLFSLMTSYQSTGWKVGVLSFSRGTWGRPL